MHLLSTFLVVGGRVIVMKKNNDSFKYRNRLNDEKDFPKIKTIFFLSKVALWLSKTTLKEL